MPPRVKRGGACTLANMPVNVYESVAGAWNFVETRALEQENGVQRTAREAMRNAGFVPCLASQAAFIAHEAKASHARSVILLGGAPIMEAVYLTLGMDAGGQVTFMDTDKRVVALATSVLRPLENRTPVHMRIIGTGSSIYLPRLNSSDYDMIVASGEPDNHRSAYSVADRILKKGGELILTDIMALFTSDSKGGVLNAADRGEKATAMRALLKSLESDDRFDTTLTSIGTGIMLCVLR